MSSKSEMKFVGLLVALVVVQLVASVESASLAHLKSAAKTIVDKAADAADKTEPAEETGGVRATALHAGANLIIDKGLAMAGNKYPVLKLAAPVIQKFSKPLLKKAHEKINSIGKKKEEATTPVPAAAAQAPTEQPKAEEPKPAEPEKKEAKPEVKAEEENKEEEKPVEKGEKSEKKSEDKDSKEAEVKKEAKEDKKEAKEDKKKEEKQKKDDKKEEKKSKKE